LRHLGADICILDGQGEQALLEVATALAQFEHGHLSEISNLVITGEGGVVTETRRAAEQNQQLPVRWREFAADLRPPVAFVRTARGCPFRCAFCNYPAMAGGQHDVMSVGSVCTELETLVELGVRDVAFVDDTFNVPLPRFKQLLRELIARELGLRWTSFFRCSNADEECFDLLAEAGCQAVFLGIESGDREVLKAMNKAAKPESYARGIAAMRERGILTMASYVLGFPGETSSSIARTLQFIEDNPTTFFNIQLYYHDLLAPVESRRRELGIEGSAYSWSHRTMDWREAADWVESAMLLQAEPIPLPLYGFSIWSLPYFMSNGFSRDKFVSFSEIAGDLFQASLANGDAGASIDDFAAKFGELFPAGEFDDNLLLDAGAAS
jgi:p-methyltransferase